VICLLLLFSYQQRKNIYIKKYLTIFLGLFLGIIFFAGSHLKLLHIADEINKSKTQAINSSSGQRLEYWGNTLSLIQKHPILGAGTGSQKTEYDLLPDEKKIFNKNGSNPHNQYLLNMQEMGLVGLSLLIGLFFVHWTIASHLTSIKYSAALQGLIVLVAVSSLFNCMLWGGEGKFYYLLSGVILSAYVAKPIKVVTK
jgi:O-antigen ligase